MCNELWVAIIFVSFSGINLFFFLNILYIRCLVMALHRKAVDCKLANSPRNQLWVNCALCNKFPTNRKIMIKVSGRCVMRLGPLIHFI